MRLLALVFVLAGTGLVAQSPTGFGRYGNPSGLPLSQAGGGFGRLIYSGTGGPPMTRRPGFPPTAPGSTRPVIPPNVGHPFHNSGIIVPFPVYYGGYYYPYDAPVAPPQGYENDYGYSAQQPAPVVILNQKFGNDSGGYPPPSYGNGPPPTTPPQPDDQNQPQAAAGDSSSIIFLIAMKDHTIFPAVAYWVDGDTLNYITAQGVRNRVSLDLVDKDFSKQLNRERSLDFALPGN